MAAPESSHLRLLEHDRLLPHGRNGSGAPAGGHRRLRGPRARDRGGVAGGSSRPGWESYHRSWSEGLHFHPRQGARCSPSRWAPRARRGSRWRRHSSAPAAAPSSSSHRDPRVPGGTLQAGPAAGDRLRRRLHRRRAAARDPRRRGSAHPLLRLGLLRRGRPLQALARVFEAALSSLEATPAEAVHVGDLRRTDIAGAQAIGIAPSATAASTTTPTPARRPTASSTTTATCRASSDGWLRAGPRGARHRWRPAQWGGRTAP